MPRAYSFFWQHPLYFVCLLSFVRSSIAYKGRSCMARWNGSIRLGFVVFGRVGSRDGMEAAADRASCVFCQRGTQGLQCIKLLGFSLFFIFMLCVLSVDVSLEDVDCSW